MAENNNRIKKALRQLIDNLESKGVIVSRLILYGSYARGNSKAYSDIDIAVISPNFKGKNIIKRQEMLGEAIFPIGEPIEALGYTPKECSHPNPLSFVSEILSTGKVVYKKQ